MNLGYTTILCPVCKSSDFYKWRSWIEQNHKFQVSLCKNCGFCYQNPRIPEFELDQFFKEFYYDRYQAENQDIEEINKKSISKANHVFEFIEKELPKIFYDGYKSAIRHHHLNILDIGAGNGDFLEQLQRRILNYTTIESAIGVEPQRLKFNNNVVWNRRILNDNFEHWYRNLDYTIYNVKYDIIILCHTLEHFYDPVKTIRMIGELLSDDGILYIEVPNLRYGLRRHTIGMKNPFIQAPEHFSFFTKNSLNNILFENGLETIKLEESKKYGNIKCICKYNNNHSKNCYKKENYRKVILKHYLGKFI